MKPRLLPLVLLAPVLVACGARTRAPEPVPSSDAAAQRGLAGYYGRGDGFHGKRTASGERFDRSALTAAHYDLPFGTRILVRNLRNNREVTLRINDRFPARTLKAGRILDVSYAAARRLGMVEAGVVPVEITVRGGAP